MVWSTRYGHITISSPLWSFHGMHDSQRSSATKVVLRCSSGEEKVTNCKPWCDMTRGTPASVFQTLHGDVRHRVPLHTNFETSERVKNQARVSSAHDVHAVLPKSGRESATLVVGCPKRSFCCCTLVGPPSASSPPHINTW